MYSTLATKYLINLMFGATFDFKSVHFWGARVHNWMQWLYILSLSPIGGRIGGGECCERKMTEQYPDPQDHRHSIISISLLNYFSAKYFFKHPAKSDFRQKHHKCMLIWWPEAFVIQHFKPPFFGHFALCNFSIEFFT